MEVLATSPDLTETTGLLTAWTWRINVSLGRSVQRFPSFLSLRDYLSQLGWITKLHVLHAICLFIYFLLDLICLFVFFSLDQKPLSRFVSSVFLQAWFITFIPLFWYYGIKDRLMMQTNLLLTSDRSTEWITKRSKGIVYVHIPF